MFRDALDGFDQILFCLALIIGFPYLGLLYGGLERPAPRPKVFGGKLLRGSHLDVLVHVARADWMSLAICVQVVEEMRATYLLDVVHQHRQLFVNDDAAMMYVMLADEAEDEAASALDLKMAIAQGRHAVSAVSLDALFRADTEIEIVDETYDDCEHALARQSFKCYVFVCTASERR